MLSVVVNVINDLADMTPGSRGFAAMQHFVNLIFRHFYATRARACAPPRVCFVVLIDIYVN
jgi:hypothetical protein